MVRKTDEEANERRKYQLLRSLEEGDLELLADSRGIVRTVTLVEHRDGKTSSFEDTRSLRSLSEFATMAEACAAVGHDRKTMLSHVAVIEAMMDFDQGGDQPSDVGIANIAKMLVEAADQVVAATVEQTGKPGWYWFDDEHSEDGLRDGPFATEKLAEEAGHKELEANTEIVGTSKWPSRDAIHVGTWEVEPVDAAAVRRRFLTGLVDHLQAELDQTAAETIDPRMICRVGRNTDGSFDELVVGTWLRVECMGTDNDEDEELNYWASIGDVRIVVSAISNDVGQLPVVQVERGFYGDGPLGSTDCPEVEALKRQVETLEQELELKDQLAVRAGEGGEP